MKNKERERCANLRKALRNIRGQVQKTRQAGVSMVGANICLDHIDKMAADALFDSARYPTNENRRSEN